MKGNEGWKERGGPRFFTYAVLDEPSLDQLFTDLEEGYGEEI